MKNSSRIAWISAGDPPERFPDVSKAAGEPNGLLAAGGDLSAERLLYAYRHGIFPWFSEGQPILWWSPDPRCVLEPSQFHVSRSLRRSLRRAEFVSSFNEAFDDVVAACAEERPGQDGTWITEDMARAYSGLRRDGWAHSVEIRSGDELVGGMYGLAIGRVFFGESMFSRHDDASKAAMLVLCRELAARDFLLLDCQVESPHLLTLGARLMPRAAFSALLADACRAPERWTGLPAGRRTVSADSLQ